MQGHKRKSPAIFSTVPRIHSVPPAGNGDSVYSRLMEAIGKPDMTSANPLYANNAARCERVDEIMGALCALKEVLVPAVSVRAVSVYLHLH